MSFNIEDVITTESVWKDEDWIAPPKDPYSDSARKFMEFYEERHRVPLGNPPNLDALRLTFNTYDPRSAIDRLLAFCAIAKQDHTELEKILPVDDVIEAYTHEGQSKISHKVPAEHLQLGSQLELNTPTKGEISSGRGTSMDDALFLGV